MMNFDAGNILDDITLDARIIPSPAYERRSTTIIRDWLDQVYDADHAIFLFRLFKLPIGAYRGSSYDLMAHAAVSEFGAVRLPESLSAPIPSVSTREPFAPVGGVQ